MLLLAKTCPVHPRAKQSKHCVGRKGREGQAATGEAPGKGAKNGKGGKGGKAGKGGKRRAATSTASDSFLKGREEGVGGAHCKLRGCGYGNRNDMGGCGVIGRIQSMLYRTGLCDGDSPSSGCPC